jgi:hypothetical protein
MSFETCGFAPLPLLEVCPYREEIFLLPSFHDPGKTPCPTQVAPATIATSAENFVKSVA